jgi:nucleotide-binding universal stress UspA family protein
VSEIARILVVLDGRPAGQRALEMGIRLARALDADLDCVAVQEKLPRFAATLAEVDDAQPEGGRLPRLVADLARDQADEAGVSATAVSQPGPPAGWYESGHTHATRTSSSWVTIAASAARWSLGTRGLLAPSTLR